LIYSHFDYILYSIHNEKSCIQNEAIRKPLGLTIKSFKVNKNG